jgi:hypothetical protein
MVKVTNEEIFYGKKIMQKLIMNKINMNKIIITKIKKLK